MLILVLAVASAAPAFGATSVTLRSSAVATPSPVTLGEVAEIEGDGSAALRGIVISETWPGGGVVELRDVREALDGAGVNWGRVTLRGGRCALREGRPRLRFGDEAKEEDERRPGVVDLSGPASVRIKIAKVLGELYGVANDDLRLLFDERDEDLLGAMELGKRYEVSATSGSSSERAPVTVTVFEGSRLVETRTVRADVRVRTDALTLRRDLSRGERIEAGDVSAGRRWVSPTGSPVIGDASAVVGKLARTRLSAGTILREAVVEKPVVIRRNELVTVHCLSGSVALRVEARAMDEGREGDVIEFRVDRGSEPFTARVSGPGVAVATDEKGAE